MGREDKMATKLLLSIFALTICFVIQQADAHGYMKDPAGRASAWRFGFKTPRNYEDDECNCGGFGNQWDKHNGACGLCGDPVQGPLRHQAGGRFATGTITKTYQSGSTIDITVFITTQHGGCVKLPPGLKCSQCVIQWKWHCGNNWGCDKSGCGMGHGQQEEFYGCADVAIV